VTKTESECGEPTAGALNKAEGGRVHGSGTRPGSAGHLLVDGERPLPGTSEGARIPGLLLPVLALALVALLDLIAAAHPWPIPLVGALDEPAHVLTAWLCLAALPRRCISTAWPWTLIGVVAIDLDHLPLYLWGGPIAEPGGRPVPHSLATVLLLLGLALMYPRGRAILCGLAAGVALHLTRDVAGGPGVPLWWPLASTGLRVPYSAYFTVLAAVAAAATWRAFRRGGAISSRDG
jgi:inner membrane protein